MRIENASLLRSMCAGTFLVPLSMMAAAGQTQVDVEAFLSTDFSLVPSDVQFRYTELVPAPSANTSTHILIEGLVPVQGDTWTSSYKGINSADGSEQDVGQIFITMPSGSASSTSGPIVGIAPRAGGWDAFNASEPSTGLGGASGQVSYDDAAGTMSFSLMKGGSVFTGTANYSKTGDVVDIDAFVLSDGATSMSFAAAQLTLWDNEYYGLVVSGDSTPAYDATMYTLRLQGDLSGKTDVPTWGGWDDLGSPGSGVWWSWNFKYMYETGGPSTRVNNLFELREFGSWVYISPDSGLKSLSGFWMYMYNWFDLPQGETGGSWVFTGTGGFGLDEMPAAGPYKVETFIYSARTGRYYWFQEYDDAASNPGNYFLLTGGGVGADGNTYWKVQVPLHDTTGQVL